jgi:hypothetical protein
MCLNSRKRKPKTRRARLLRKLNKMMRSKKTQFLSQSFSPNTKLYTLTQ